MDEWEDVGNANVGGFMTVFKDYYYRYARNLENGALWIVAIKPHQAFMNAVTNAQFVDRRGDSTTEPIEY